MPPTGTSSAPSSIMKLVYCSSQTPGTALSAVPMMPIDQTTAPSPARGARLFHASEDM
jgi:hypothetical protein